MLPISPSLMPRWDGRRQSAMRYLLMQGYHCPPLCQTAHTHTSQSSSSYLFISKSVLSCMGWLCCLTIPLLFNSCMKPVVPAVTKLPKVSPDFSPIVLFGGRDIWSSGAPHVEGGEYIVGRGDPIIQIISPPVFAWIISLGATVSTRALRRSLLIFDCGWRR